MSAADLFVLDTAPSATVYDGYRSPARSPAGPGLGASPSVDARTLSASTSSNGLLLPGHVTYEERNPSAPSSYPSLTGVVSPPGREQAQHPNASANGEAAATPPPPASSSAAAGTSKLGAIRAEAGLEEDANGELGDFVEMDADDSMAQSRWARYYEDPKEEEEKRNQLLECNVCGETGHLGKRCPHSQCLACGALDEHTTRECPHGVVCFRCGQTGHRISNCPQPRQRGHWQSECIRCGSSAHQDKRCPTLWRVYNWNTQEEWKRFRKTEAWRMDREQRRLGGALERSLDSDSDASGSASDMDVESDTSRRSRRGSSRKSRRRGRSETPRSDWDPAEIWCYNCAAKGAHWGDDCTERRSTGYRSADPTAYSHFMSLAGPFGHMFATRAPIPRAQAPTANGHIRFGDDAIHGFDFDLGDGASMRLAQDPSRSAVSVVDELIDSGRATGRDKRSKGPPSKSSRAHASGSGSGSRHAQSAARHNNLSSSGSQGHKGDRHASEKPLNARLQQREAQSAQQKQRERDRERDRESEASSRDAGGKRSKRAKKQHQDDREDDWFDRASASSSSRRGAPDAVAGSAQGTSLASRIAGSSNDAPSKGPRNKDAMRGSATAKEQRAQRRRGEPEFGRFARADSPEHAGRSAQFRPQFHGDY